MDRKPKFLPNLNKAKNKERNNELKDIEETVKPERSSEKRPRKSRNQFDPAAKKIKREGRYVQSHSIFKEGVGALEKREPRIGCERMTVLSRGNMESRQVFDSLVDESNFISDIKQTFNSPPLGIEPRSNFDPENEDTPLAKFLLNEENNLFLLRITDKLISNEILSGPDCHIGKIQILDNGKVRFKVGEVYLNLEGSNDLRFTSDLVNLEEKSVPDNPLKMTSLGHVKKFIYSVPNIQEFIENERLIDSNA